MLEGYVIVCNICLERKGIKGFKVFKTVNEFVKHLNEEHYYDIKVLNKEVISKLIRFPRSF